jgi:hypothetical protein
VTVDGPHDPSGVELVGQAFTVEDDEVPEIAVSAHRLHAGAVDTQERSQDAFLVGQRRHPKD